MIFSVSMSNSPISRQNPHPTPLVASVVNQAFSASVALGGFGPSWILIILGTLESTKPPIPRSSWPICHRGHGAIAPTSTALGADTRILKASQGTSDLCQDAAGKLTTVTPSRFSQATKRVDPKREKIKGEGFGKTLKNLTKFPTESGDFVCKSWNVHILKHRFRAKKNVAAITKSSQQNLSGDVQPRPFRENTWTPRRVLASTNVKIPEIILC